MGYLAADLAVEAVLTQGVSLLLTDDTAWDLLLQDISAAERVAIRNRFRQGANRTPTVLLGYPRAVATWPIWAVYLAMETPEQEYVDKGSDGPMLYAYTDHHGSAATAQATAREMLTEPKVSVVVATKNARETAVQATLVGRLLLASVDAFFTGGFKDLRFVSRGDLAPDPTWMTDDVFARRQDWSVVQQESAALELGDGIALTPPVRAALPDVDFDDGDFGRVTPEPEE